MTNYKTGDIFLLEFPFSDTLNIKKRPAFVILDTGDEDIICARITAQIYETNFDVNIIKWQESNLLVPSVIRYHKIATLDKNLVLKKLGSLLSNDNVNFKHTIKSIFSLNF
ncbi:MAG: type II toxin-antitoxin system PemK/MazF family toxin [Candidatus Kapabacteria bacterium]|nr:type II toxin-antitoxin system PemK/MazF family toxin [Candidatus Kapabacteria bacterium]